MAGAERIRLHMLVTSPGAAHHLTHVYPVHPYLGLMLYLVLAVFIIVLAWFVLRRRKRAGGPAQAIDLRCTLCGNYYPSRDHFATDQVCKACHARQQPEDRPAA